MAIRILAATTSTRSRQLVAGRFARTFATRAPHLEQRAPAAEDAKKHLTYADRNGICRRIPRPFDAQELTRDALEEMAKPFIERTLERCELALEDAKLDARRHRCRRSGRRLDAHADGPARVAKMFQPRAPVFD